MDKRKILIDLCGTPKLQLSEVRNLVIEANGNKQKVLLTARGEFGRADVATQNRRKYPRALWDREIKRIAEAIAAGKVLGHLDHPCLTSNDFRVLTVDGWKEFSDIKVGDRVWSLKNGKAIESSVEAIVDQEYEGDAYEISGSRTINATFTPAHKFVLAQRNDRNCNEEIYETIENIVNNRNKFTHNPIPKSAIFDRPKTNFVTIPRSEEANPNRTKNDVSKDLIIDAKVFAAFMGIYLAEGGTSTESSDNWRIDISQKNEWSRKYIYDEILSQFPEELKWSEAKTGFHLADARLYRYLRNLGDQYSKRVPKEVKTLDADCLKEFIFWFMIGDGRLVASGSDDRSKYPSDCTVKESLAEKVRDGEIPTRVRRDLFSVSEKLIQDIHECLVLSGGSGTVSMIEPDKDYEFAGRIIKAENKVPLYQLHISTANAIYLSKSVKIEKIKHIGRIYCLTTTNGNFYMERKGKAFWTGNSDGKTSLTKVSHVITELHMLDDGTIIGEARICDNEHGRQLKSILEAGGAVGVSSRGLGSTSMGEDGMEVVGEDYEYMTHDFVADPAVITSYPKFQMEVRWMDRPALTETKENKMSEQVETVVVEAKKDDNQATPEIKADEIPVVQVVGEKPEEKAKEKPEEKKADVPAVAQSPVVAVEAKETPKEEIKVEAVVEEPKAKEEIEKEHKEVKEDEKVLATPEAPKEVEAPKVEEPKAEKEKDEKEKEEKESPEDVMAGTALVIALENISKVVAPFMRDEDTHKMLKERDEKIELLKKEVEIESLERKVMEKKLHEAVSIADKIAGKLIIAESLLLESEEDRKGITQHLGDMTSFIGTEDAEKALTEARQKHGKDKEVLKKLSESKNAEILKLESVKKEKEERIAKLEKALLESTEINRTLGKQMYLEKRIIGNPNASKIRELCEGKVSKQDIDAVVDRFNVASGTSEEYNAIRRRLSNLATTTLVEDHVKESGLNKSARGPVEQSVEAEMAEIFPESLRNIDALM